MKNILSIFLICLFLFSCATPQQGSGIRGTVNVTQPELNNASLYIKYSSGGFFNVAPIIEVNTKYTNEKFLLGDDEYKVVKVSSGPAKIIVFPPLDKIRHLTGNPYIKASNPFGTNQEMQKIFIKESINKNNNYYFVIRPERGSGSFFKDFLDHTKGKAVTVNYGIYETNQESFVGFQSKQPLGVFGSINEVPNIHGFTEDVFTKEGLIAIAKAEESFKSKEIIKIQKTINQSEEYCSNKGIKKESNTFDDCKFDIWKKVYGKKYMDYKNETILQSKLIQQELTRSSDSSIKKINQFREGSLEISETTKDIIKIGITLVASYYLGKAIGEALKQSPTSTSSSGNRSAIRYVCFIRGAAQCTPQNSGYAFVR